MLFFKREGCCQKQDYKNSDILYLKDITYNTLMFSIHTHNKYITLKVVLSTITGFIKIMIYNSLQ